ncbi:hypothetical protein RHAL1_04160 [Beijerinckiaceae bacterium RH AL1]|jgi:hypothetical protein|nr:hypothetical protein [Beijerinckiaceae bacterium]VVB50066.1 hypothetical protein RHCH11_RHCH11_04082 [Beijerinckiaceae bacterium RH CH11]VVB50139.1 hypothetical protein RHAL8_04079 [Beijerinckiaceae bacterium RH AL8]VVC57220.1 hypothetical protein RHAL1_04160 [Beijerinckiaceae bacterium RH AL1]
MKLAMFAAAAFLGLVGTAAADEVIIHRDAAPVVVDPAPSSSTTTVEKHVSPDGCASKTVHSENDVGDSKTEHTEHCD